MQTAGNASAVFKDGYPPRKPRRRRGTIDFPFSLAETVQQSKDNRRPFVAQNDPRNVAHEVGEEVGTTTMKKPRKKNATT